MLVSAKTLRFPTLVLTAAALMASVALAAPMGSADATKAVGTWLVKEAPVQRLRIGTQVGRIETYRDADGEPMYHIVYLKPAGFVIVSGDDSIRPIIGFSSEGAYSPSADNPMGALVHGDMTKRVKAARTAGIQAKDLDVAVRARRGVPAKTPQLQWNELLAATGPTSKAGVGIVTDPRVDPLVVTKWDQYTVAGGACYNYYTPPGAAGSAGNYVCGCVATAMAQLMRYHQHPVNGVGTGSYQVYVDYMPQLRSLIGGNGSGGPYVWSSMPAVPTSAILPTERQAIGALCSDAGVAVHMQYTNYESGAYMSDANTALMYTFKYANSVLGGDEMTNIGQGLVGMINPNLDAGYPVLLGITGSIGGHAIVCDGYGYIGATLYHHLNMGWSGYDDAWYNLPLIDTSIGTFSAVDSCNYNVFPFGWGEIISGRVLDETTGAPLSGVAIDATDANNATYSTTTNARGIYALAKVPSNMTFTINATAPGHTFTSASVTTGTSYDYGDFSGNVWGVDFGYGIAALSVKSDPSGLPITGTVRGTTPGQFSMTADTKVTLTVPSSTVDSTSGATVYFNRWTDANGNTLSIAPTLTLVFAGVDTTVTAYYSSVENKGYVLGWGLNTWGQVGDGTSTQQDMPVVVQPFLNASLVAAGQRHTLLRMANGEVYAYGGNYSGQLGDGTTIDQHTPVRVNGLPLSVTKLAAGGRHSLALTAEGYVYAWGSNSMGQLGFGGGVIEQLAPAMIPNLNNVVGIAAGDYHSLVVKSDGSVWAFGANLRGQLGDGTNVTKMLPTKVLTLTTAQEVSAGSVHSMARTASGVVYTWGGGDMGQLGNGATRDSWVPITVPLSQTATSIAAGWQHSLAALKDGAVSAWGSDYYAQLGNGWYNYYYTSPVSVLKVTNAIAVAGGGYHSVALDSNGQVWTWGWAKYGQLGTGTSATYAIAKVLTYPNRIKSIAAGGWHTAVVADEPSTAPSTTTTTGSSTTTTTTSTTTSTTVSTTTTTGTGSTTTTTASTTTTTVPGTTTTTTAGTTTTTSSTTSTTTTSTTTTTLPNGNLYVTGANSSGQLGLGTSTDRNLYTAVASISDAMVMTGGQWHSFVIRADGTLWGAGVNAYGQLGRADTNVFLQVPGVAGAVRAACSDWHSVVLLNDGTLVATGSNMSGALGMGDNTYRTTFGAVPGIAGVKDIAAGSYHTVAVTADGSLWATGSNTSGQLGLGVTATVRSFTKVPGITTAVAVAAGDAHTLVLLADGTVMATGLNTNGQLGLGNTSSRTNFAAVASLGNGVAAIAARGIHSVALKSNGDVWVTGCYKGIGRASDTNAFVKDGTLSGIAAITTGLWHTVALKSDGSVWVTGANDRGQLGLGDYNQRDIFVKAASLNGALQIGTGALHTLVAGYGIVTTTTTGPSTTTTTRATTTTTASTTTTTNTLPSSGHQLRVAGKNARGQLGLGDTTPRSTFTAVTGMSDIINVAVGYDNALIVRHSGVVLGAGSADNGKLGSLTGSLVAFAVVPELSNCVAVAASSNHSVALGRDGTVWTTGVNYYGQLGLGDTANRAAFTRVTSVTDVVAIAAGEGYTLALRGDGTVWGAGNNGYGQLGLGAVTRVSSFTQALSLPKVAGVFAGGPGGNHSALLLADGGLMTSGWNANGQLGLGDTANRATFTVVPGVSSVRTVAVGSANTAVVRKDDTVWTAGAAMQNSIAATTSFALLTTLYGTYAADFCMGDFLTFTRSAGTLRVTGANSYGELGVGDTSPRPFVTAVSSPANIQAVVAGGYTSMILVGSAPPTTSTTTISTTSTTQTTTTAGPTTTTLPTTTTTGTGSTTTSTTTTGTGSTTTTTGGSSTTTSTGLTTTTTLPASGYQLVVCGANDSGQLGLGSTGLVDVFTSVSGMANVISVASNGIPCDGPAQSTLIVRADGTVWGAGLNARGELGGVSGNTFAQVPGVSGVKSAHMGPGYAILLKTDGTIMASGANSSGQLGLGDFTDRAAFAVVPGVSGVVSVACGTSASCVALKDGAVWYAGYTRQVGAGGSSYNYAFTRLTALGNIVAVAASGPCMLYLRGDGTVWAAGDNSLGELGVGDLTPRYFNIAQCYAPTNPVSVCSGGSTSSLLRADGTLWVTGGPRVVPFQKTDRFVQLPGAAGVIAMCSGYDKIVYVQNDGTTWGSGYGHWGMNGNTATTRRGPIRLNVSGAKRVHTAGDNIFALVDSSIPSTTISTTTTSTTLPPVTTTTLPSASKAFVTGGNFYGSFAIGDQYNRFNWTPWSASPTFRSMLSASGATFIVKDDCTLWFAGACLYGTLAGYEGQTLKQITGVSAVTTVAGNTDSFFTITTAGDVYACGVNNKGQLGTGDTVYPKTFTYVRGLTNAAQISVGAEHTVVLRRDGSVWVSGSNSHGQLGVPGVTSLLIFTSVLPAGSATAVCAHGDTTTVLLSDKTIVACGDNTNGAIGLGDATDVTTLTQVLGIFNVTKLAVPLLLKDDGSVLHTGPDIPSGSPSKTYQPVAELSDIVDIQRGTAHAVALKSDGTVWLTGENLRGPLGPGVADDSATTFVKSPGVTGVNAILTGEYSSFVFVGSTPWPTTTTTTTLAPSGYQLTVTGANSKGELGLGDTDSHTSFTPVPSMNNVISLASNGNSTLVVKADGTVWVAGDGFAGVTGSAFQQIPGVTTARRAFVGAAHAVLLMADGTLMGCGSNAYGELGLGTATDAPQFVALPDVANIRTVACSARTTCVVELDGTVYYTGLGSAVGAPKVSTFQRLSSLGNIIDVQSYAAEADYDHMLFLRSDGLLFGAGANCFGSLGTGSLKLELSAQVASAGPTSITRAATSRNAGSAVVRSDGTLWVSGGDLGTSLSPYRTTNVFLPVEGVYNVTSLACMDTGVVYTRSDGSSWASGVGPFGRGDLYDTTVDGPIRMSISGAKTFVGAGHDLFVLVDTNIPTTTLATTTTTTTLPPTTTTTLPWGTTCFVTGANFFGALGVGDQANRQNWTPWTVPADTRQIVEIGNIGLIVKNDGTLWLAGSCYLDTLSGTEGTSFRQVAGIDSVASVSAAKTSTWNPVRAGSGIAVPSNAIYAVLNNGDLYVAGYSDTGSLGLGDHTKSAPTFTRVPGISNVASVSACDLLAAAVKTDGTVWVCGYNYYGQLGLGDNNDRDTFVQVPGVTNAKSAVTSHLGMTILLKDGTMLASGYNGASGYLGLGDGVDRVNRPTAVPGISEVTKIAPPFAITSGGKLWYTGRYYTMPVKTTYTQISGITSVADVQAGSLHAVALNTDGTLAVIGDNLFGQLGAGFSRSGAMDGFKTVPGVLGVLSITVGSYCTFVNVSGVQPTTTTTTTQSTTTTTTTSTSTTTTSTTTTTLAPSGSSARVSQTVDNRDRTDAARWFSVGGTWMLYFPTGANGPDCAVAVGTNGAETARCSFTASQLPRGSYNVYAWWPAVSNPSKSAAFEVYAADAVAIVRVDQTRNAGQWVLLGAYTFADRGARVEAHNGGSGAGRAVVADAVRFVPTAR